MLSSVDTDRWIDEGGSIRSVDAPVPAVAATV
jgi:hypothetical protein